MVVLKKCEKLPEKQVGDVILRLVPHPMLELVETWADVSPHQVTPPDRDRYCTSLVMLFVLCADGETLGGEPVLVRNQCLTSSTCKLHDCLICRLIYVTKQCMFFEARYVHKSSAVCTIWMHCWLNGGNHVAIPGVIVVGRHSSRMVAVVSAAVDTESAISMNVTFESDMWVVVKYDIKSRERNPLNVMYNESLDEYMSWWLYIIFKCKVT